MQIGHQSYFQWIYSNVDRLLIFIFFCIAILTFSDYGISWDEYQQHKIGTINYEYVFHNNVDFLSFKDRDYGVAFELPLILIEKMFGMEDPRSIYLMRHFLTHLFFLLGAWYFFRLIKLLYQNKWLAVIGFFLLVSHPRIYGHSFFNSKDIPFLSMFIIALFYSVRAFYGKSIMRYVVVGVCAAILVNLRIMGVLLPAALVTILFIDALRNKTIIPALKFSLALGITFCIVLYITWPFLWSDPIDHFIFAFKNMSKFRWDHLVLFEGQQIRATQLDWSYLSKWMIISTPIVTTISCALAVVWILVKFVINPLRFISDRLLLVNGMFLAVAFAPILAVIVLNSVVYDGWRQLFFVYPAFILVLIFGLHSLNKYREKAYKIALVPLSLMILVSFIDIARLYPYQHTHMNHALSHREAEFLRKNYELDYWGLSYRESLEWILRNDDSKMIRINPANAPGAHNINLLPKKDRDRIEIVMPENADYFITNYRWHPEDYDMFASDIVYSVKANNNTINSVFKFKK